MDLDLFVNYTILSSNQMLSRSPSKSEITFLGYVISADGIQPDTDKTRAVMEMEMSLMVSDLRSFLGMVKQLRNSFLTWLKKINR